MSQMSINPEALYCFLDADVLLQFTTFDQVDWLKFLNTHQVHLVLPITVISELNDHKDDGSKPHLQQRARMLLSKIDTLLSDTLGPARIREGIYLSVIPKEPIVNWSELELDQNVRDDRILARIILFKQQYPEVAVCFLTNDHSSRMKARDLHIHPIKPDSQVLVQLELKSSQEAEIRALKKELNEYKNRLPKLEFGFYNGQELTKDIAYPFPAYDVQHATILSVALTDDYTPQQVVHQRTQFDQILRNSKGRASDFQIKEFVKEYEEYLEKFEPALKRKLMSEYGQKCYLAFAIKNIGTAPATDFRLALHFPPGTLVIDANDAEQEIEIPVEPKPSWMADPPSLFGLGNFGLGNLYLRRSLALPTDPAWHLLRAQNKAQATHWGPICNETNDSHIVSYRAKKLQHEDIWRMRPIVAYLIPNNTQGFSIDYYISTDESPKKIPGELNVRWTQMTTN